MQARTVAPSKGAPSRTIWLGPVILVAISTRSRLPVRASQRPMISSETPIVSRRTGLTGYISAQSRKVIPASSAMSICWWPPASSVWVPKAMVPRQIRLTSTALPPNVTRSIRRLLDAVQPRRLAIRPPGARPRIALSAHEKRDAPKGVPERLKSGASRPLPVK